MASPAQESPRLGLSASVRSVVVSPRRGAVERPVERRATAPRGAATSVREKAAVPRARPVPVQRPLGGRLSPQGCGRTPGGAPGDGSPGRRHHRAREGRGAPGAVGPGSARAPAQAAEGGHPGGGGPQPVAARRTKRQVVGAVVRAVLTGAHRGGEFTLSVVPIWI